MKEPPNSKLISSAIRQKGELKTGITKKQSTPNFPKNKQFLPPDTHTYVCVSRGTKCSFFGKFGVFCFLFVSRGMKCSFFGKLGVF